MNLKNNSNKLIRIYFQLKKFNRLTYKEKQKKILSHKEILFKQYNKVKHFRKNKIKV